LLDNDKAELNRIFNQAYMKIIEQRTDKETFTKIFDRRIAKFMEESEMNIRKSFD